MNKKVVILFAEDDEGHAGLIMHSLKRAGIRERIVHFKDGSETLNFLFREGEGPHREADVSYILLLDIRMPKVDGIEVMIKVKQHKELHKIPIIMVSTMEDPVEMEKCWKLGCSNYFVKPVEFDKFSLTMEELGNYMKTVIYPEISGDKDVQLKKTNAT